MSLLVLCEKAVHHLKKIGKERPVFLRIRIKSGGCSGLKCEFSIEYQHQGKDVVVEKEGAFVIIDALSLSFIEGAEVDYGEDLMSAQFILRNPRASSACGCGESFSL